MICIKKPLISTEPRHDLIAYKQAHDIQKTAANSLGFVKVPKLIFAMTAGAGGYGGPGGLVPLAPARDDRAASKTQNGLTIFTESVQALAALYQKWSLVLTDGGLGLCLFARQGGHVKKVPFKECVQCGANMIAPTWSEHLSEHCVRNVWSCEACGYQFEDTIYISARELAGAD